MGLLAVLAGCQFISVTSLLVVLTLLDQIGTSLHESRPGLDWLLIACTIAGAVGNGLFPAAGSLLGQRRVMVGSMTTPPYGHDQPARTRQPRTTSPRDGIRGPQRVQQGRYHHAVRRLPTVRLRRPRQRAGSYGPVHPGRIAVGVGHGMPGWLDQVGARPASPLTLLEEYISALRRLLAYRQRLEWQ
jgi:hypothetical protein